MKITWSLIVVGSLLLESRAFPDDVYNFYWQKGAGPQTVIQSGQPPAGAAPAQVSAAATTAAAPAVASAPPATSATTPAEKPESVEPSKWTMTVGYTSFHDDAGPFQGVAVGVQWNPTSYLGLEAQLLYGFPESGTIATVNGVSGSPVRGQVGLSLTPFRLKIFGAEMLSFSALGGAMTYSAFDYPNSCRGDGGCGIFSTHTEVGAYAGVGVGVEVLQSVALVGQAKMLVLNDKAAQGAAQYLAGLNFRF